MTFEHLNIYYNILLFSESLKKFDNFLMIYKLKIYICDYNKFVM
jgi:hypothetical protein